MTTITYHYTLSTEGQRACLLAGLPAQREQTIQIDATQDAVALASIASDGTASLGASTVRGYETATQTYDAQPTAESIAAEIVAVIAATAMRNAQRAAQQAQARAAHKEALTALFDNAHTAPVHALIDRAGNAIKVYARAEPHGAVRYDWLTDDQKAISLAYLVGRGGEVQAEIERRKIHARALADAQLAEQSAGIERMRTWALGHGSERVRLMIGLQTGKWQDVARDEFFAQCAPNYGGVEFTRECWAESGDDSPRTKPTLEELQALAAMREACAAPGSIISSPELLWCVVDEEIDDDGAVTREAEKYTILYLTMAAPDGAETGVAIRLDDIDWEEDVLARQYIGD